ncbi:MAG: hypothetical protein JKX91_03075 [Rhizobiaceae bacterium]|nr:hypothetical protein [Rhizobiaceae bacterium]
MNIANSTNLILPEMEKRHSLFGFASALNWLATPVTASVFSQTKNSKGITE